MPAPGPGKTLCAAQLPNQPKGRTCKLRAGARTDHLGTGRCYRHGGNTPSHEKHAEVEQIRQTVATLGLTVKTTPAEALLNEIYETAGNVEFYRSLVQELPTHPTPAEYIPADGEDEGHWERGEPGVYGPTYHVSGIPTGEAKPHILVTLYNDERKHLAAITVAALKVGIAEQMVRIAEGQATQIAGALRGLIIALGHDPADPKVREAARAQLTVLAGGRTA